MTAAREVVLGRVRAALEDRSEAPTVPRDHRVSGELSRPALLELFVERLEETGARVVRAANPGEAIRRELEGLGAETVVVDAGLAASLRPAGLVVSIDNELSANELDSIDGAVTTCLAACAETATLAFDGGPGQGRRAITLVPDLHVCVVAAEQVVETVPELIARLEPSARAGRALVLVSGPSATSDIEFQRVEGVHGPRTLVVVLVDDRP